MTSQIVAMATTVSVKGTSMSTWAFIAVLGGAFILGGLLTTAAARNVTTSRGRDGKPWWYDVAFPQPDEATLGGLRVLADRYALGEIDADEYQSRAKALRDAAPAPSTKKKA